MEFSFLSIIEIFIDVERKLENNILSIFHDFAKKLKNSDCTFTILSDDHRGFSQHKIQLMALYVTRL